jgi:hypothetical protein
MFDPSEPLACDVYPIKNGFKILRKGVRIGLASSLERALDKITRKSADLGVLYHVRIYKADGSLDSETRCPSPHGPAKKTAARRRTFPAAIVKECAQSQDAGNPKPQGEDANAGISMRERIALLAYAYWEKRGRQGGSPEEDWLRAEREISRAVSPGIYGQKPTP